MKYLLMLFPLSVYAVGYEHNITNVTEINETTINKSSATAIGIATSQHHFDFGTYKLQGSVGVWKKLWYC